MRSLVGIDRSLNDNQLELRRLFIPGNERFTSVEAFIDAAANRILIRLPQRGVWGAAVEFAVFGLKQGWACLFGGLMLGLMIGTSLMWPDVSLITRYDFLFLSALAIQLLMLVLRLETLREARVILIFHLVGTAMEIFKTSAGSWVYPGDAIFQIGSVPLFSGFMYASVGSYLARVTRIFDIRLDRYPPLTVTAALAFAIYFNFFSHHFIFDFRFLLFAAAGVIFWPTWMHFRVHRFWFRMPILGGFLLVTLFIWIAENIGTLTRIWVYPAQVRGWIPVGPEKIGSWFLLMIISVVLVTLVHPPMSPDKGPQ